AIADDSKWTPYTSKEGKFTILLPGTPKEQTQEAKTAAGTSKIHTLIAVVSVDEHYVVVFNAVPAAKTIGSEKLLDSARDGRSKSFGNVAGEKRVRVGKANFGGREVQFEAKNGKSTRARYFLVDETLFQVIATGKDEFVKGDEVTKFLQSFKPDE